MSVKDVSGPSFLGLIEATRQESLLRMHNGEFTERGLAKLVGISQTQMHHVLAGKRTLRPELADKILRCFGLVVSDLL